MASRLWHRHRLDLCMILAVGVLVIWFATTSAGHAPYQWQWNTLAQYLVRINADTGQFETNWLLHGLFTTLRLSVWSLLLALCIGGMAALARLGSSLFNRLLGWAYVAVNRNLPPLILIVIFYYFISSRILPMMPVETWISQMGPGTLWIIEWMLGPIDRLIPMLSAVMTLALFEGAYMAEIFRAGVLSIPIGQWEAGCALGMNKSRLYRHVVLPQAIRRMLPPLAGQAVSTIKDSAIVSIISIPELTFQASELMASTYMTYEIWITVALLYLLLTLPVSTGAVWLENRLQRRLDMSIQSPAS